MFTLSSFYRFFSRSVVLTLTTSALFIALPSAQASTHGQADRSASQQQSTHFTPFDPSKFKLTDSLGIWYEVARLPASFEKGCVHVVSNYKWYEGQENKNHDIQIDSVCTQADGSVHNKSLYASPVDMQHLTSWHLSPYHWMLTVFNGVVTYQILYFGPKGQIAILGSKEHNALWLLSRKYPVSEHDKNILINVAKNMGFDLKDLIWTYDPNNQ